MKRLENNNSLFVKVLFALIPLFLLMGCNSHSKRVGESLSVADSLIELRPDSALHLLESIDYNGLPEEEQAHFGLLFTAARYKLYQPVDTHLINRSIRYYTTSKSSLRTALGNGLAASLYYKGVVLYELGKKEEAVLLLKQAEEQAERSTDELLRNKVYEKLFSVSEQSGNLQMAIQYGKMFLSSSKALGDSESVCRAYDKLACAYSGLNDIDSMEEMQEKCKSLLPLISKEERAYILSNLADSKINTGQYDDALTMLSESLRCKELPNTYYMLGLIYHQNNDTAQAMHCFEKVISMDNIRFQIKAYRRLSEYYSCIGKYQYVLSLMTKADSLQNELSDSENKGNVAEIVYNFDQTIQKKKYDNARFVFLCVALLLFSFLIAYQLYVRQLKRRERRKNAEIWNYANNIQNYNVRIDSLEHEETRMKQELAKKVNELESLRYIAKKDKDLIKENELTVLRKQQTINELLASTEGYREQVNALQEEIALNKSELETRKIQMEEKDKLIESLRSNVKYFEDLAANNQKEQSESKEAESRQYKIDAMQLALGKSIHDRIKETKSFPHMTSQKEQALVNYYIAENYDSFIGKIEEYENLSVALLCYLVLDDMGLSHAEMQAVLNVKESSIRMRLKRLNEKKRARRVVTNVTSEQKV